MARIKRKEMSKHFAILFLFFQTLCQICHSLETVESHNQGEDVFSVNLFFCGKSKTANKVSCIITVLDKLFMTHSVLTTETLSLK